MTSILLSLSAHAPRALQVFEWLMFSDSRRDAHRFADAVRAAVADGRAKDYRRFRTWAAGVDERPRPKDPLAGRAGGGKRKSKAAANEQALVAQIRCATTCSKPPLRNGACALHRSQVPSKRSHAWVSAV